MSAMEKGKVSVKKVGSEGVGKGRGKPKRQIKEEKENKDKGLRGPNVRTYETI